MPTYELRRRGYNVTAKPTKDLQKDFLSRGGNYAKVFKNPEIIRCYGDVAETIKSYLKEWGEGARSEICVVWKSRQDFSHIFAAENRNGKIIFVDPQLAVENVDKYFESAKEGYVFVHRMDNLEFTELIKECCEEVRQ